MRDDAAGTWDWRIELLLTISTFVLEVGASNQPRAIRNAARPFLAVS